ncbi:DNA-3-methyladenine glycosylase I [Catenulispora acidiphila]|uniref:DNA-3-methyladenine glycosylase I n=1 Tax=Catenulispora acidiphila TaxID=304895 RepID=UPI0005A08037|nr:DNA-3-methyladenine glycosylase I [Catenulispora acidiphila]
MQDLVTGEDGIPRCGWAGTGGDYAAYHDTEWGRTLHGDDAMFERLSLEGFQAGLAWITVLRKREAFRKAFKDFQIDAVAALTPADVELLLTDPGIIRSRAKIESAIHNARIVRDFPEGLDAYLWNFAPPTHRRPTSFGQTPTETPESKAMAKALKKAGVKFIGPTSAYALMQATGMVDDHLTGCFRAKA